MKFAKNTVQTRISTPLGDALLAATPTALVGVWVHDQRHLPAQLSGDGAWPEDADNPHLQRAATQLAEYFAGTRDTFDLELDLSGGTAFQQSVWRGLLDIQCGDTASYGDLSRSIGNATAVRAVGAAVGRNPFTIVVPCHRILGADGSLTGYAGGLARKEALLRRESVLLC